MLKKAPPSGQSRVGNLFSFFASQIVGLISKLSPGWANDSIDAMLFTPRATDIKPVRLPHDMSQFVTKTPNGDVQTYQIGKGPAIVFVHGWGGAAQQFFPLMRGLSHCGFSAIAFDQLGHGLSEKKPAPLKQFIATSNHIFNSVNDSVDGLRAVVGHSTGCIAIANATPALLRDKPLFLISPIFDYKLYFLKKLHPLKLRTRLVKEYSSHFGKSYRKEYQRLELAKKLPLYADYTVIAHDESDTESAFSDSEQFCAKHPVTKLLATKNGDHVRVINSESVWQELKSHLNYDDTTVSFTTNIMSPGDQ